MKIIRTVLFFLLTNFLFGIAFGQSAPQRELFVGKWELKSHWMMKENKRSYVDIKGSSYVYDFSDDGTFVFRNSDGNITLQGGGKWELLNDGKQLRLYDKKTEGFSSEGRSNTLTVLKITSDELVLGGDMIVEGDRTNTSLYKRVK